MIKDAFHIRASLNRLFTPPNSRNNIGEFDSIRFFGMLLVLLGHTGIILGTTLANELNLSLFDSFIKFPNYLSWITNANFMVDLFFILSGFLIASILFREQEKTGGINVRSFYYRRFIRLMPVYFFVVCVFYMANVPNKNALWQNLLYINNFFPHRETSINWTWSLAVEEQFYLVFPLFLLLFPIKNSSFIWSLIGLFILSFIIRYYIVINDSLLSDLQIFEHLKNEELDNSFLSKLYDNLYTRYGAFICGIMIAVLYKKHLKRTQKFFLSTPGRLLILTSIIVFFFQMGMVWHKEIVMPRAFVIFYYVAYRNIFSLVTSIFLLAILTNSPYTKFISKFLRKKIWYPYSQLTYSAYLIHIPCILTSFFLLIKPIKDKLNIPFNFDTLVFDLCVTAIVATFMTYILSIMIYIFIEAPLLIWRDEKSGKSFRETN